MLKYTPIIILLFSVCSLSYSKEKYPCDNLQQLSAMANNGDLEAQFNVGICLFHKNKREEAADALKISAKKGHLPSVIYLGHCYYNGIGVEKNKNKAVQYYKIAADKDNPWGLYYLAQHLSKQYTEDRNQAINLYERAAEQKHMSSIAALIKFYSRNKHKYPQKTQYWINVAKHMGYDYGIRRNPLFW